MPQQRAQRGLAFAARLRWPKLSERGGQAVWRRMASGELGTGPEGSRGPLAQGRPRLATSALAAHELEQAAGTARARLGQWLQRRRGSRAATGPEAGSVRESDPDASPLQEAASDPEGGDDNVHSHRLGTTSPRGKPRTTPVPEETRLGFPNLLPMFVAGEHACRGDCGRSSVDTRASFKSEPSRLEFVFWGFCEVCQRKYFFPTPLTTPARQQQEVPPTGPFSELSPLAVIPVAYPDRSTSWVSAYHLFVAHHFLEPWCREIVWKAPFGKTPQALRRLLDGPRLRDAIRQDWECSFASQALRHVIFLLIDQHPALAELLAATSPAPLLFDDMDHVQFWGVSFGNAELLGGQALGENAVGKILEEKRRQLIRLDSTATSSDERGEEGEADMGNRHCNENDEAAMWDGQCGERNEAISTQRGVDEAAIRGRQPCEGDEGGLGTERGACDRASFDGGGCDEAAVGRGECGDGSGAAMGSVRRASSNELQRCSGGRVAHSVQTQLWIYRPQSGAPFVVRAGPYINGPKIGTVMPSDSLFLVSEVRTTLNDGIKYLKLAEAEGWLFDVEPGVGRLCWRVPEEERPGLERDARLPEVRIGRRSFTLAMF